jgi:hypothetical protein
MRKGWKKKWSRWMRWNEVCRGAMIAGYHFTDFEKGTCLAFRRDVLEPRRKKKLIQHKTVGSKSLWRVAYWSPVIGEGR